jgi:hypothetical protein
MYVSASRELVRRWILVGRRRVRSPKSHSQAIPGHPPTRRRRYKGPLFEGPHVDQEAGRRIVATPGCGVSLIPVLTGNTTEDETLTRCRRCSKRAV